MADLAARADAAYARQDYAAAAPLNQQLAEGGRVDAMVRLGWMYEDAQALAQSDSKATEWYRQAAEKGDPAGMSKLGRMYENGKGVTRDLSAAAEWYRRAAGLGDDAAMEALGRFYAEGEGGITQDDPRLSSGIASLRKRETLWACFDSSRSAISAAGPAASSSSSDPSPSPKKLVDSFAAGALQLNCKY